MILQNEESESDAYQRKNDCEDWEKLECLLEEDFSCGSHVGRRVWQNAAAPEARRLQSRRWGDRFSVPDITIASVMY